MSDPEDREDIEETACEIEQHVLALVATPFNEREAAGPAADRIEKHIDTGYYGGDGDEMMRVIVARLRRLDT